jgi:thymidine kinase
MSKVYFFYAAMNAGKSTLLLQSSYNYNERGQRTLLFSPAIDTRAGPGKVSSRVGLSATARSLSESANVFEEVSREHASLPVACVLVDEAQFLTDKQVWQLTDIADVLGIPVLCYGLRTDFQGNLFVGAARLLAVCDKIQEIKGICHCGRKATMNLRMRNGAPVREGAQVEIGGNDLYLPVCRKHFKEALVTGVPPPPMKPSGLA